METEISCGNCGFPVVVEQDGTVVVNESPKNEKDAIVLGWENTEFGLCCPECVKEMQEIKKDDFEMPDEEGRAALLNIVSKLRKEN
ncbi:hypothetical protein EBZ38_08450 [bacterium]|nr:hypothetical protein [bacterium]